MKRIVCTLGICALLATSASADIYLNEVLGSTTSTDSEFIELYNSGPAAVDISNWAIELWDSDSGSIGGSDGGSPYTIDAGTTLAAGGYYLLANTTFSTYYAATPDQVIQENAIENSSYTVILKDTLSATIDSVFVTDGGAGDTANDGGTAITPNATAGPDGTFLPAGFYRAGDGSSNIALLEFSPQPAPSATPGAANLPEPASLVLLGIAGMFLRRR